MFALPVAERELRTASRRAGTWRVRFWSTLAALCTGLMLWESLGSGGPAGFRGIFLYSVLSVMAFAFVLFMGPFATADCVSNERRDGTLGLLFLTDLRAYDVVLGKLVARGLHCVYGLVAILPVLALPMLLGGITATQFWKTALVLLNALFFGLSVGMAISAISLDERRAMFTATFVVLMSAVGPWIAGVAIMAQRGTIPAGSAAVWLESCTAASPLLGLLHVLGSMTTPITVFTLPGIPLATSDFWKNQGLVHLLGWSALIMATVVIPRFRERAERPKPFRGFRPPMGMRTSRTPGNLLDRSPYQWLTNRGRNTTAKMFLFIGSMALITGILAVKESYVLQERTFVEFIVIAIHFFFRVWISIEACTRIHHDRRTGAFELLLTVPGCDHQLARDHVAALTRQFAAPVAVLFILEHTAMAWARHGAEGQSALIPIQVRLIADLLAIVCVGNWRALKAPTLNRAVVQTLGLVLIVPWLVKLVWGLYRTWIGALLPMSWTEPMPPTGLYWSTAWQVTWDGLLISVFAARVLRRRWREAAATGSNS
jgi:ABC-type transport system involved in multi-copper enzyme maturation permease subunit